MRIVLTLAALLATAPATALTFATDSFRDAATGFRVEVSYVGPDMVLDGFKPDTRERLHLVVDPRGHVTGIYRGKRVDYVTGQPANAVVAAN